MAEADKAAGLSPERPAPRRRRLLLLLAPLLLIAAIGAGAALYLHGISGLPGIAGSAHAGTSGRPVDVDVPELTLTLPNGGHPRQLRIRLTLELTAAPDPAHPAVSPRLYDALLTYLRTLTDADLDGGLAIERLRSDLFRRIDLVLGPGVLRDVLITGLLVA